MGKTIHLSFNQNKMICCSSNGKWINHGRAFQSNTGPVFY